MKSIGIINGPNLNLTGRRETAIYGQETFEKLLEELKTQYPETEIHYFQSNVEGEIINCLQEWGTKFSAIILNAGGYTHTSVSIGDAVKAIESPVIEVHMSNIMGREDYRKTSLVAPGAEGIIMGFGMDVYRIAFRYISERYV